MSSGCGRVLWRRDVFGSWKFERAPGVFGDVRTCGPWRPDVLPLVWVCGGVLVVCGAVMVAAV